MSHNVAFLHFRGFCSLLALVCAAAAPPLRAETAPASPEQPTPESAPSARGGASVSGEPARFADVDFDPRLLMGGNNRTVDLSRFTNGNLPEPGRYDLDIYLNGIWLAREAVRFDAIAGRVTYCTDPALFARFDVDAASLSGAGQAALARSGTGACVDLAQIVPGASVSIDINRLRLDVAIPQAMLAVRPRGYVDPAIWDDGVNAAILGYRMNYFHTGAIDNGDSGYVGLTGGLNLGGWRFRHQGALTIPGQGPTRYQNIVTYVQKDIRSLRSRLTLGDSFTDGMVFDTVGIRGVQLASDDQMLPDSLRGYAPLVRGTARTNARVTVTQNGVTLYETTVAPGPFVIRDLYASGYGANLVVTVTEADGTRSSFTVPYASAPQLVRKGRLRFSVAGGRLRDGIIDSQPAILLATAQYGLGNRLTLYGGGTLLKNYRSGVIGAALNTSIGAFSADVTGASTDIPSAGSQFGHRFRLAYSSYLDATQTSFTVATYMQSSRKFWDLRDATRMRDFLRQGLDPGQIDRERRRFQATVNQDLGDAGSFYASGSLTDYWNRSGSTFSAQAGYSKIFRLSSFDVAFNLDYSRLRDLDTGRNDNRILASITIPFGRGLRRPTLSATYSHADRGRSTQQLRLSGTALEGGELSYGLVAERGSDNSERFGGNIEYRAAPATLSATASAGDGSSQYSLGMSGGIIVHPGGVTFANQLGDTVGIVEAKGAAGARVLNSTGVRVDGRGYAVVPYLSPYRENIVSVDTSGLPLDVQFRSTTQRTVPTADAVVMVRYATDVGRSALITVRRTDGKPVPFGAALIDDKGVTKGVVGQNGGAFASGLDESGTLSVDGGDGSLCRFDYALPPRTGTETGYAMVQADCDTVARAVAEASPDLTAEKDAGEK